LVVGSRASLQLALRVGRSAFALKPVLAASTQANTRAIARRPTWDADSVNLLSLAAIEGTAADCHDAYAQ
jgi:hypothetical protein